MTPNYLSKGITGAGLEPTYDAGNEPTELPLLYPVIIINLVINTKYYLQNILDLRLAINIPSNIQSPIWISLNLVPVRTKLLTQALPPRWEWIDYHQLSRIIQRSIFIYLYISVIVYFKNKSVRLTLLVQPTGLIHRFLCFTTKGLVLEFPYLTPLAFRTKGIRVQHLREALYYVPDQKPTF